MKKKLLSLFLALVLVLGCLPLSASAGGESEQAVFQLDQTVTVSGKQNGRISSSLGSFTPEDAGWYRVAVEATPVDSSALDRDNNIPGVQCYTGNDDGAYITDFRGASTDGDICYSFSIAPFKAQETVRLMAVYPQEWLAASYRVTVSKVADENIDSLSGNTASFTATPTSFMLGEKYHVFSYTPAESGLYNVTASGGMDVPLFLGDFVKEGKWLTQGETCYIGFDAQTTGTDSENVTLSAELLPAISPESPVTGTLDLSSKYGTYSGNNAVFSFTAPEAGIYVFTERYTYEAKDADPWPVFVHSSVSDPTLPPYTWRTVPVEDFSNRAFIGYFPKEEGIQLRAALLEADETISYELNVWSNDNMMLRDLELKLHYTVAVRKAAEDHVISAEVNTSVQTPEKSGSDYCDPDYLYFYKFTAPANGYYGLQISEESDWLQTSSTFSYYRNGERVIPTLSSGGALRDCQAGDTWYVAAVSPYGWAGTFTVNQAPAFAEMKPGVAYGKRDLSVYESNSARSLLCGTFVPETTGEHTFTMQNFPENVFVYMLVDGVYVYSHRVGKGTTLTFKYNLKAGEKCDILIAGNAVGVSVDELLPDNFTIKIDPPTSTPPVTLPIGDDTPDDPENPTEPTVETETAPDGTVTTTTTWTDGKKAVQEKTPDGSAKVEVTSSTGETIAKVELPADPGAGKEFEDVKEGAWYEGAVDKATAYGLFDGSTETTFAPNGSMTRGMVAQVLYNLSGKTGYGAGSGNFTDVAAGKWYENAIDWAAKAEIVSGTGNGSFSPEQSVTREQLVSMLYRYAQAIGANTKKATGLGSFPDGNSVSDYAKTAMQWAVAEGFISGRNQNGGKYIAPNGTATRAEVAAILTRFVEFLK